MPKRPPAILDLDMVFLEVRDLLTGSFPDEGEDRIREVMGFLMNEIVGGFETGEAFDEPHFVRFDGQIIARLEPANDADAGRRVFEIEETDRGDVMREVTPNRTKPKRD
jgi:hypothetical protein